MRHTTKWTLRVLTLTALAASAGCTNKRGPAPSPAASTPAATAPAEPRAQTTAPQRLVAVLSMKQGFGPADHDAYEASIAPIGRDHGMARDAAYTVQQHLGGTGPKQASTIGIWDLETAGSLQKVMGDARYQAHVPSRDRVHDMAASTMYLAEESFTGAVPAQGHALLVGLIAMKPGFGFDDHLAYERSIAGVTERHGMRLVRSFRVTQALAGARNVAAVNVWELAKPEALGAIMSDREYQAHVADRDRTHDMAATTMYFVAAREDRR